MSYYQKCWDLAEVFLDDTPEFDSADNRNALAQEIQDCIEDFIASLRDRVKGL